MKRNLAMRLYWASHKLYEKKLCLLASLVAALNRTICACQIPPSAVLSKSTYLLHNGLGVVIHERAVIGENVVICQNVTIGGGRGGSHPTGCAVIKESATLGAGCCTLGPIVVGAHAKVGANAVVLEDVPDYAVAVGIPARIVRQYVHED